jgi:hypothetical protein
MMKKFLFLIMVVLSVQAYGQLPAGFTKINQKYNWISGVFDSALRPPRDTSLFAPVGSYAFMANDKGYKKHSDGHWHEDQAAITVFAPLSYTSGNLRVDTTSNPSGLLTKGRYFKGLDSLKGLITLQQVLTNGSTLTANAYIDADSHSLTFSNVDEFTVAAETVSIQSGTDGIIIGPLSKTVDTANKILVWNPGTGRVRYAPWLGGSGTSGTNFYLSQTKKTNFDSLAFSPNDSTWKTKAFKWDSLANNKLSVTRVAQGDSAVAFIWDVNVANLGVIMNQAAYQTSAMFNVRSGRIHDTLVLSDGGTIITYTAAGGGELINLSTNGPSAIGFGNAATNPALAYVKVNTQWMPNALVGDNIIRNTGGRLLWGNSASAWAAMRLDSNTFYLRKAPVIDAFIGTGKRLVLGNSTGGLEVLSNGSDGQVPTLVSGVITWTTPAPVASVATSSATTLTLSTTETYVFTGSSNTAWTLPAISGNTARKYLIKNRGTANITLSAAGSDNLFLTTTTTSIVILPGDAYTVQNDSVYWIIM